MRAKRCSKRGKKRRRARTRKTRRTRKIRRANMKTKIKIPRKKKPSRRKTKERTTWDLNKYRIVRKKRSLGQINKKDSLRITQSEMVRGM